MKRVYFQMFLLLVTMKIYSFTNKDLFGTRVFVENKGQFDKLYISNERIKFGFENGEEKIYFTNKGLIYVQLKSFRLTESQKEAVEEGEEADVRPTEVYKVFVEWKNSNSSIQILEEEKQAHYFTYGDNKFKANCYKKLTYKNVYNNIDIEYIIPEDKSTGIKYNVILHPGADPSKIQIAYSGDVKDMQKNASGDIIIGTSKDPITEHAPYTFMKPGKEVKCDFSLNNKVIGFDFKEKYKADQEITIDPWITTISTLSTTNYGYDVDFDNFGNLFVYGGSMPHKLAKYNSSGVLQWTFAGILTTPAWNAGSLAGNFVVKKTTGQSFVGQGIAGGGTRIIRLDPAGAYDNLISTAVPNWLECWDMAYHCSTGTVFGLGGAVPSNLCSGILDQVTGSITPVNFFNYSTNGHDVVSHTVDNNGEVYLLYASVQTPALNNQIAKINSAFTSSVWIAPSTFMTMNEANNKVYTGGNNGSNGFNALASNGNYLFYYDGFNVSAYNKTTGNILGSTTIASFTPKKQGGIAVDDCNNLYLGGDNGNLVCFHFTGSNFTPLPGINLNVTATTYSYVCDVRFDKVSNLLYVSGSGFCGTFNASNSSTCALVADCNFTIPNSNTIICLGAVATVSIGNPNGLTNPSYSIQPAGQTQSSPIFTVSPSVTTTYTLYITGLNSSNLPTTNTTVATVSIAPVAIASPSLTNGTCANPVTSSVNLNLSFNPSGNPNYTTVWSPLPSTVTTANSSTAAGLTPGINNVTITTANGCVTVVSFSVPPIPLPADFIVINPGGSYTVTCNNPNVLLTTSVTNGNVLSYTWFPSCTGTVVGNSMTFNQACTGQVVGTTSTGCIQSQTFTIYQDLTSPTIAVTPTIMNITCAVTASTFTGTSNLGPNVTTNWFQVVGTSTMYVGAAGGTINIFQPGQPGVYWFESINNITGCKSTMSVQVTASIGVPIFTVTSTSNFTVGCSTTSITSLQVSTVVTSPTLNVPCNYAFVVPPATATPVFSINPNLNNITIPGTYVVYIKDLTNNCISSQSISIIQNTVGPNISFIQPLSILSCKDPSMVLNGISSNSNTIISWTVPATPSNSVNPTPNNTVTINPAITGATNNITSVGIFTVGAMDNNNLCRSTKTVQVNQDIRLPKFTISALTNSIINCKNTDVLIVPVVTPSLAVALVPTFMWYPPIGAGTPGTQFNTTSPGTHTSISTSVVNGCTYSATYNVAVDFSPPAIGVSPDFTLDCATNPTVSLFPTITGVTSGLTYTWIVPPGALTSNLTSSTLVTNLTGDYLVVVTNTINGCQSQAFYKVVGGNIHADFIASSDFGYAPLAVTFSNTSATSTGASSIISTWGYGNGAITQTVYNTSPVSTTYTSSGTYSVILTVQKGTCIDTAMHTIIVDIPSKLEIPNVFTPNGDKSNDIFRLRSSNLGEVYIIIFDRWGTKVYELNSDTGNFAWDGKNQAGKECADGTYFYILKATGKDKQEYDLRGNVSLYR